MNLQKELKQIGINPLSEKTINYKLDNYEVSINYEEYHKQFDNSDIAIFYIFDVSKWDNSTIEIINNYDEFISFQEKLIAKKFFLQNDYLRYNLYIVFVLEKDLLKKLNRTERERIERDFAYSRKIFLNNNELNKYFNYFSQMMEQKPAKKYDEQKFKVIRQCISSLNEYGLKSTLTTKLDDNNKDVFRRCVLNMDLEENIKYDSANSNNINPTRFFEKHFKSLTNNASEKHKLDHIYRIQNEGFRKSILKEDEIYLKLFNLLFGENATGKTSLLELIEYTLTGKNNKVAQDKNTGKSLIYSNNGNVFSSDLSNKTALEIKNEWYKDKIGSLNKLFCRVNYFDIDAAYNFAIEYGKNSYQEFFCDYQLLFMKENILAHIDVLKSVSSYLDSTRELFKHSNANLNKVNKKPFCSLFSKLKNKNENIFMSTPVEINAVLYDKYNNKQKNINNYISVLEKCIVKIDDLLESETQAYIEYINTIYWILFSKDQIIKYDKNKQILMLNYDAVDKEQTDIDNISTAQRVCVALSVIFTQFFSSLDAPRFILLDETVANFDSIHLLNLMDFLRELSIHGVQIVFTTADTRIKRLVENKFSFLKNDFQIINISDQNNL